MKAGQERARELFEMAAPPALAGLVARRNHP